MLYAWFVAYLIVQRVCATASVMQKAALHSVAAGHHRTAGCFSRSVST